MEKVMQGAAVKNGKRKDTSVRVCEAVTGSKVWSTPFIPDIPTKLFGIGEPKRTLNETTGNGTWKFLYDIPDYAQPMGIPGPYEEDQDFDFTIWNDRKWDAIKVPGEPLMQGFDIQTNNEYYYRREITIPDEFSGNRIFVRFDGVYSNARVWIDGHYIRTHIGGFTTWDCDITEYALPGTTVTMVVGVADIYSVTKGIWNPTGKFMNNPADASKYAHHNIGGINRDVFLVAMPYDYIARTYVETHFDKKFKNADLNITVQLGMISPKVSVKAELIDNGTVIANGRITFERKTENDDSTEMSSAKKMSIPVEEPRKWDAEHPNLYILRMTLSTEEKEVQINEQKIGFREIYYGGKEESDINKIYVNGKEIKLRGTCRHDVSASLGRSMTREEYYEEVRAYKRANINYIRTSHYPAAENLLEACDELGLYVEDESAVCFQGPDGDVYSRYEDFMPQFTEMIEKDRNHVSVLIWSLGNESFYNKVANQSGGNAFQDERDYLKDVDNSRPCVFSWLNSGEPENFVDIRSEHYADITGKMGSSDKPVLHEEYAHVSCYNLDELQRDINVRNFWGESIKKAWENIFETDGALGGALWSGIDDVFYIPDGTTERWQTHSGGRTAGYGEWGSVLDAYFREKPEAYLTKKAYSPVRVQEDCCFIQNKTFHIPVKNWFDHTDMNELQVEYTAAGRTDRIQVREHIFPHSEGVITIPDFPEEAETVKLRFYTPDGIMADEYNVKMKEKKFCFEIESDTAPCVEETKEVIIVRGKQFTLTFDKRTGLISKGVFGKGEKCLITGGPYLHVTGMSLGEWTAEKQNGILAETQGKYVVITMNGSYTNGQGVRFILKISDCGMIEVHYELTTAPEKTSGLSEIGISFNIVNDVESVNWERRGIYSSYPEDHIGRNVGTAYRVRAGSDANPDLYGVKPGWSWKDDMKNYYLYPEADPHNGLVTNDFKTMREHIYYYSVNYKFGEEKAAIRVEDASGSHAARVNVSCNRDYIDDRSPDIRYIGSWKRGNIEAAYEGTETYSTAAGDRCEFTFNGTGIRVIGARQENTGKMKIYLDDRLLGEENTYSNLGKDLKQSVLFSAEGLEEGEHTIKFEALGNQNSCIVLDAFEVLKPKSINRVSTKLIINDQWYYPNLSWGNYPGMEGILRIGLKGGAVIHLTDKV